MLSYKKILFILPVIVLAAFSITSCNKEFEDVGQYTPSTTLGAGPSIGDIINNDTSYSFFKAVVAKAGTAIPAFSNTSLRFTAFLPTNSIFRQSGITSTTAAAAAFPTAAQASAFVAYAFTPQLLLANDIPTTFPNLQAPSLLNPTAGTTAFNPYVSLSLFPSRRTNAAFVNNIPLFLTNVVASNGYIQNTGALLLPPSATLWSRISTDPDMTFFKAAVTRGDSGKVGTARIDSLLNLAIGPNFTVFVPTNAAMTATTIGLLTQGLIAQGVPAATAQAQATTLVTTLGPGVYSYPYVPVQTAQAVAVYHILPTRFYSVNFPTTATAVPTLLNSAIPTHPGVLLAATFNASSTGVTAATVKGAANATASNILINPTPSTGTSDQDYTNGVLHKIDQVLLPQ